MVFTGVTCVLMLIYVSNRLIRFLTEVIEGALPTDVLFQLILLKAIGALVTLLPLSLFLAIFLALGRLYKDSEMTALAACGVGYKKITWAVMQVAFVVAGLVYFIAFYLAPSAEERSYQIQDESRARSEFSYISAGQFQELFSGKKVLYTERISDDRNTMRNLFIRSKNEGNEEVVVAKTAMMKTDKETHQRYFVLSNGVIYQGVPGEKNYKITRFKEYGLSIQEKNIVAVQRKLWAYPADKLFKEKSLSATAEIQWRFSMVLSSLILALLAIPLSHTNPRQGKYSKLFIAIIAYGSYSTLLGVSKSWVEDGSLHPIVGASGVHVLFVCVAITLILYQSGVFRRARSGQ